MKHHETRDGNTITIQMTTIRPKDVACATVITEYQEVIPLGRFSTGDYRVVVNGVVQRVSCGLADRRASSLEVD